MDAWASGDGTPWAAFEAQAATAREQAWEAVKADYLASVAQDNADAATYQSAVGAAYVTEAQTTATADVAAAQATATDDLNRQITEAQDEAAYQQGIAQATAGYATDMASAVRDYKGMKRGHH